MTDQKELEALIALARRAGATVHVTHDEQALAEEGREIVDMVQVSGLEGVGRGYMPAVATAEALRKWQAGRVEAAKARYLEELQALGYATEADYEAAQLAKHQAQMLGAKQAALSRHFELCLQAQ